MTVAKLRQLKAGEPQVIKSVRELYTLIKMAEAWDYLNSWMDDEGIKLDTETLDEAIESFASEVGLEWVETADLDNWLRNEGKWLLQYLGS